MGGFDGVERFGERTDLVDLDEDRVGDTHLDAIAQACGVRHEQVVADELALGADEIGQDLPAFPVVFGHAVLDRDDRVLGHEVREIVGLLAGLRVLPSPS